MKDYNMQSSQLMACGPTLFGTSNENFVFETWCKAWELKNRFHNEYDFSAHFYFAQLFVLFSAQSIIFFVHFQQKWLLIHWL